MIISLISKPVLDKTTYSPEIKELIITKYRLIIYRAYLAEFVGTFNGIDVRQRYLLN